MSEVSGNDKHTSLLTRGNNFHLDLVLQQWLKNMIKHFPTRHISALGWDVIKLFCEIFITCAEEAKIFPSCAPPHAQILD